MSDNESESSCVSALEDPSLGCTTPEDPKSRSNLPDDDQTDPRSISESTSQSYQDCPLLSSQEAARNPSPETSKVSVSLTDSCERIPELPHDADDIIALPKEHRASDVESPTKVPKEDDPTVKKQQEDVESPKSEERFAKQESADESDTKKRKKDEPIDKETLEKYAEDVESPKKEERLAKQESSEESPTKQEEKDKPAVEETFEKYTEHIESPSKAPKKDDPTVEKQPDDLESLKSEERFSEQESSEEPLRDFVEFTEYIQLLTKLQEEDDSDVEKHQDVVESPKKEERKLAEQGSAHESPTKKQKKDEPIGEEILEEYTEDAESHVEKHQDFVESPKSEKSLAEQRSADESPTKQYKKDEPADEENTEHVKSPTKVRQKDEPQDVVKSPKSKEKTLAEQGSADESPTKKQRKDKPIDKEIVEEDKDDVESLTKLQQEDDPPVEKHQDVVESLEKKERLEEQESADESPAKPQNKDEPTDKGTLEEYAENVESPEKQVLAKHESDVESSTKVQQEDDPIVVKDEDVVQLPTSIKPKKESVVKKRLAEHERDVESPTKKQKDESTDEEILEECKDKAESSERDKIEIASEIQEVLAKCVSETCEKRKDDVVLPKPEEEIKCESVVQESPTKQQMKNKPVEPESPGSTASRTLLDKEYFEYILRGFYKNNNIEVDECEGGDESSLQPSFMCDVKKFTLIGRKEKKQKFRLSVIVKELYSKEHQELYKSNIAAKNEEIAYNTIFPILNIYGNSDLPVPICFFASDVQIIVQDLCIIKYKTFEKIKGFITPKECMYTLKALAKFHAATFVLRYKNNVQLEEIKNLTTNTLYSDMESPLLQHQYDSLEKILSIHISRKQSQKNVNKVKALEYLIKVAKNDIKDLLTKEQDDYVFCHGDLLLTNILYKLNLKQKAKDDFEEIDIKLIDFQKVYFCSVASDLVYLFFVNLKPEDYIDNKADLLTRYFHYLKKNVIDCGVGDDFKLTYEWLLAEIDRFTEYGIIYALWILPMFGNDDDNKTKDKTKGTEVTKEMLEDDSKKICYNERMRKWVDYYTTIYTEKFQK